MANFIRALLAMVVGLIIIMAVGILWKKAECYSFSLTTGYWVKFDPLNGCFVLIDDSYFLNKDLLVPGIEPALDPDIVGLDAVLKQEADTR